MNPKMTSDQHAVCARFMELHYIIEERDPNARGWGVKSELNEQLRLFARINFMAFFYMNYSGHQFIPYSCAPFIEAAVEEYKLHQLAMSQQNNIKIQERRSL